MTSTSIWGDVASAIQITSNPIKAVLWSILFAEIAAVDGFVLSLAPGVHGSVFVAFLSFMIYLICRVIGGINRHGATRDELPAARTTDNPPHHLFDDH